jgi:hypothetical protein
MGSAVAKKLSDKGFYLYVVAQGGTTIASFSGPKQVRILKRAGFARAL